MKLSTMFRQSPCTSSPRSPYDCRRDVLLVLRKDRVSAACTLGREEERGPADRGGSRYACLLLEYGCDGDAMTGLSSCRSAWGGNGLKDRNESMCGGGAREGRDTGRDMRLCCLDVDADDCRRDDEEAASEKSRNVDFTS